MYLEERLCRMERRIAILEGKPDPGLPCPRGDCLNGKIDVCEDWHKNQWATCPICLGSGKVFPLMSHEKGTNE